MNLNFIHHIHPGIEILEKIKLIESGIDSKQYSKDSIDLSLFHFFCITSVNKIEEDKLEEFFVYQEWLESILSTLFQLGSSLCILYISHSLGLEIYWGTDGDITLLEMIFSTHFSKGKTYFIDGNILNKKIQFFPYIKKITGDPHSINHEDSKNKQGLLSKSIDILIRGLFEQNWAYMVIMTPCKKDEIQCCIYKFLAEIDMIQQKFPKEKMKDSQIVNYYIGLLEFSNMRLQRGIRTGIWYSACYFLATDIKTATKGSAIVYTFLSGQSCKPEPLRIEEPVGGLNNALNSYDLTRMIQLPLFEFPGWENKVYVNFDAVVPTTSQASLDIGHLYVDGLLSNNLFSITLKDLQKHIFIAGITGSGKTNTTFQLLSQLWMAHKTPFMVIEPAKFEYRNLFSHSGFQEMCIFTLGDENKSPIRINPFEFPASTLPQTHIDYLKALFLASFQFVAPTPYILEECIVQIYQDRGWNFASGKNLRGSGPDIFPTISDLYRKIDEVTLKAGYDKEITKNISASLKTRIQSLKLGGKGFMLDTKQSLDFTKLMEKPVVLELYRIGNDQEKAFLIGLILIKIYEHCEHRYHSAMDKSQFSSLKHLFVIEEAHRLLKRVENHPSSETGDASMEVLNLFSNMLAELRSFGEGFCIIEQIPSKLASDVLKNTNVKFLHRIVAEDDKKIAGATMNLSDKQQQFVTSLLPGDCIVFQEGMDNPVCVKIKDISQNLKLSPVSEEKVAERFESLGYPRSMYLPYNLCCLCSISHQCIRYQADFEQKYQKTIFDGYTAHLLLQYLLYEADDVDFFSLQISEILLKIFFLVRMHCASQIQSYSLCYLMHSLDAFYQKKAKNISLQHIYIQDIYSKAYSISKKLLERISIAENDNIFEIKNDETKLIQNFQYLNQQYFSSRIPRFPVCQFCKYPCLFWDELLAYWNIYPEMEKEILIENLGIQEEKAKDIFFRHFMQFQDTIMPSTLKFRKASSILNCLFALLFSISPISFSIQDQQKIVSDFIESLFKQLQKR